MTKSSALTSTIGRLRGSVTTASATRLAPVCGTAEAWALTPSAAANARTSGITTTFWQNSVVVAQYGRWIVAGLLLASAACARREPTILPGQGQLRGANVLLVTIDTLRRDRVGAF